MSKACINCLFYEEVYNGYSVLPEGIACTHADSYRGDDVVDGRPIYFPARQMRTTGKCGYDAILFTPKKSDKPKKPWYSGLDVWNWPAPK